MTYRLTDHASRQIIKATIRGDLDAAFRWTILVERQLDIIGRLVCLDETDRRLRRYRGVIAGMRAALLAASQHPALRTKGRKAARRTQAVAQPDSR